MQLATILTRDVGHQHYLIDSDKCWLLMESDSRRWPDEWKAVSISAENTSLSGRAFQFASIDDDGIVRSDMPYETVEDSGTDDGDGIVVGRTITLWHNHAAALSLVIDGKRGQLVECSAEWQVDPPDARTEIGRIEDEIEALRLRFSQQVEDAEHEHQRRLEDMRLMYESNLHDLQGMIIRPQQSVTVPLYADHDYARRPSQSWWWEGSGNNSGFQGLSELINGASADHVEGIAREVERISIEDLEQVPENRRTAGMYIENRDGEIEPFPNGFLDPFNEPHPSNSGINSQVIDWGTGTDETVSYMRDSSGRTVELRNSRMPNLINSDRCDRADRAMRLSRVLNALAEAVDHLSPEEAMQATAHFETACDLNEPLVQAFEEWGVALTDDVLRDEFVRFDWLQNDCPDGWGLLAIARGSHAILRTTFNNVPITSAPEQRAHTITRSINYAEGHVQLQPFEISPWRKGYVGFNIEQKVVYYWTI